MKHCVIANLLFNTPAKRDKLRKNIKLKIGGKKAWGDTLISTGEDMEGYPSYNLTVRFDNEADMDDLFAFIKDKMEKIPVLKGTVTKHNCTHDEKVPQPCVISEEYSKL